MCRVRVSTRLTKQCEAVARDPENWRYRYGLVVATALELVGGVSLVVGFRTRWGALALLIFLVPVTLVFHNFWAVPAAQQQMEMANFLKNLAIAGGLLIVFGRGAGAFSIDNSREAARGEPVAVTRAAQ